LVMRLLDWLRGPKPTLGLDREKASNVVRPAEARCPKCKQTVVVFRRYADGSVLCVTCAGKR